MILTPRVLKIDAGLFFIRNVAREKAFSSVEFFVWNEKTIASIALSFNGE